jgi:hypothetical protein
VWEAAGVEARCWQLAWPGMREEAADLGAVRVAAQP